MRADVDTGFVNTATAPGAPGGSARTPLPAAYAETFPSGERKGDLLFARLLAGCLLAAALCGAALLAVPLPPRPPHDAAAGDGAVFHVSPNSLVRAEPVVAAAATAAPGTEAVVVPSPERAEPAPTPEDPPPARRVYGTRRVLARGLGAEGGSGALVVRLGNTVDGVADTLTATAADLREAPPLAGAATTAPVPVHRVRPEYSALMREHRASGTVVARLLIDVDGRVARTEIIEDCGFDSRDLATAAFARFRFEPARRDGAPVAVWIVHKIRFEFQER